MQICRNKIAFHLYSEFEISILRPIYELLKESFSCILTKDIGEVIAFHPDILVLANHHYSYFRKLIPEAIIVWTRHGFANKNSLKLGVEGADFACVSSDWVKEDCIEKGLKPRLGFWVTGFVLMDKIFSGKWEREQILPEGFPFGKKTLLYAPTWNRYFTSIEILGIEGLLKIGKYFPHLNIIVKLHPNIPHIYPWIMKKWERIKNDSIILIKDSNKDIYQFFPFTDILLTDASSVMFFFLAMNRPIILLNNPKRFLEKEYYDPIAPEWKWRDMGEEVETLPELIRAIGRAMNHPEERTEKRALYRERVFGNLTDGKASERIAKKLRALLKPENHEKEWVDISWNAVKVVRLNVKGLKNWKKRRFLSKIGKLINLFPPLKLFIKRLIRW